MNITLRRTSVSVATIVAACFSSARAQAEQAPADVADLPVDTLAAVNPNAEELTLVKFALTDADSANGGSGVSVALLDGLTDCTHPDLAGRCVNVKLSGTYTSYSAHGTHTAGTIAGAQFGIATNAKIINYAVFDDKGFVATGSRLIDAWSAAYASGARIASMSFGCSKMALCRSTAEITAMADPLKPMLYVKAAGNQGSALVTESKSVSSATAAGALNRTLLVGSVNSTGTISSFSNTPGEGCLLASGASTCVESMKWKNHFIVAPGEFIYATFPGNSYDYMSGTSMATPIVAGAAALLQARWPALKDTPETLAKILLTTATDLGAAGVDPIYGHGLLNIAAAFQANGTVSIISPTDTTTPVSSTTTTTTTTTRTSKRQFGKLRKALNGVTVYDQFGRDFALGETNAMKFAADAPAERQLLGGNVLGQLKQSQWASRFFADEPQAAGFAYFGAPGQGNDSILDRSTRMGVDLPFKGGLAQLRLTGAGDPRLDMSYDDTMRPLANFASTGLLRGALIGNALINVRGHGRLMAYAIATAGELDPQWQAHPIEGRSFDQDRFIRASLRKQSTQRRQTGFGIGYWKQSGENTVVGINLSAIRQTRGYYSISSDFADFERPTGLVNLGGAVSRQMGSWELSASAEVTHLRMGGAQRVFTITPATMVSGNLGVKKTGVLFGKGQMSDGFGLTFSIPPRAVKGSLQVDYMTRTADGTGRMPASIHVPLADLGSDPPRLEAAYHLARGERWSFSISGGINLSRSTETTGRGDALASLKFSL